MKKLELSELNEKVGLDDSIERLIQDEIGRKIERIRQEIKEDIERRERNRRIELNNQKFDELQREELLEEREARQQQTDKLKTDRGRDRSGGVGSDNASSISRSDIISKSKEIKLK